MYMCPKQADSPKNGDSQNGSSLKFSTLDMQSVKCTYFSEVAENTEK